jgi:S-adenosyl-L-methionine hydrolase (adenosine-forming)
MSILDASQPMVVTLTTDFGCKDPYAGIMKGVIATINPYARVIDLSHGIPPQDVLGAALILRYSVNYFPRGSIHVAVVDPGVGSARRPLLIGCGENYFIGPDNGVLSLALEDVAPEQIIHLSNAAYHRHPSSTTFHGRDVFAPVAAHLSLGTDPRAFGEAVQDFARIAWPGITKSPSGLRGEIVYVDGFGNLFSNVTKHDLEPFLQHNLAITVGDVVIYGLVSNYEAGRTSNYVALINSWGLLEIAVYQGNAQQGCGARIGDKIQVRAQ